MSKGEKKLKSLLKNAYILGGSPCSGKSSITEMIAAAYGYPYYKVDDHNQNHLERAQASRQPVMHRYSKMSWNEIWMRPVEMQVSEVFEFFRERFKFVLEDLHQYETSGPLLLEGAAYLPALLRQYGFCPNQVLFLIPTREFQVEHYRKRPWIQHILKECDDPGRAFENWMNRDYLFGQEILRQAQLYDYETIIVDGSQDIPGLYGQVIQHFFLN